MSDTSRLPEARLGELIDSLVTQGWYVGPSFLPAPLCSALHAELDDMTERDALIAAGIGRGDNHHLRRDVRGDAIRWLDRESQAQRRYLEAMGDLQRALNQALFLGLFEYEAHFAHYPPGAFYRRHLDSFRGRANRVVSTVGYLTPDWPSDGGGEMVIYSPDDDREVARVRPEAGTFVCFLAETIPHEVLPTRLPRASIAGWFRRNASLNGLIDPAS
ncbi:2OG-Fe(II) oxygenase [Halomonas elongata]|uniref:2OG-Fe(II) oxygenase n=2 Tax=Halomonas elongata TaxID=2746 RepID=E1V563_HALED|nr:2OG-Fe(II) oxygenase [Halomonas elongata]MBW5799869.1 2OG-Fe(II) oxygenase [Halomonas elongata]MDL4863242.1 2OG-Fe(II) oxygenase [Halomonas elongata]WBF16759.1 2OG-Fe(II) oxygenase [Halomonas elongata]WPU45590.1 2OG-Fe(II) oxygenase [Halomonas elongata DSM 2581]WVI70436.1 2OG-Fe(II) oxygenase [Halomonas elongata]